jgi:hypothetical protein
VKSKSTWVFLTGGTMMIAGLLLLASGLLTRNGDTSWIPTSLLVFSLGSLALAAGFYIRVRALESELRPSKEAQKLRNDLLRSNGACSLCGENPAVIRCTIHGAAVCPVCLSVHDNTWCEYVPMGRRSKTTAKGAWR